MPRSFRLIAFLALVLIGTSAQAATLDQIRERGSLICAVAPVAHRALTARQFQDNGFDLDADYCRALALAIFGDAERVEPLLTNVADRIEAITSGAADIAFGNMTVTASREQLVQFPIILGFEAQAFVVADRRPDLTLEDLAGETVCVSRSSTSDARLAEIIVQRRLTLKLDRVSSIDTMVSALRSGRCKIATGDRSALIGRLVSEGTVDPGLNLLREVLGIEPYGPIIRVGDPTWSFVVRWVYNALILAEEVGVGRNSIALIKPQEPDPRVRRLVGLDPHPLMSAGLSADSLAHMLKMIGNFGEIYQRNQGQATKFGVNRGPNALVRDGGLILSSPY